MFKKSCPLILVCLLCAACVSKPGASSRNNISAETSGSFFQSIPGENRLVFIGAAGRRSNPKETLQLALEDAARKAALFQRVSGEYAVENNIGSGAFDYSHDTYTALNYDIEGSKQYVESLKYDADTDSIEIDNTFFIRTTYPAALPVPVGYRPRYSGEDNRPDWVDNLPREIDGYDAAVSYSGRLSSLADTFTNSCHNAIFALIKNINTVTQSSDLLYENTGSLFGYKTANNNITYSYGTLIGFYILDTWLDPKTKWVWTLAIAKKSQ